MQLCCTVDLSNIAHALWIHLPESQYSAPLPGLAKATSIPTGLATPALSVGSEPHPEAGRFQSDLNSDFYLLLRVAKKSPFQTRLLNGFYFN